MHVSGDTFLSFDEIARRLNRSRESVRMDLTNGLRKLKTAGLERDFTRLVILTHASRFDRDADTYTEGD